jgi:hypothetical protein
VRAGEVAFSFHCPEDVLGFVIDANHALHAVSDDPVVFECQRETSRSFYCSDVHSAGPPGGSGVITLSEPLCRRGSRLMLHIGPSESPAFTLEGPC